MRHDHDAGAVLVQSAAEDSMSSQATGALSVGDP